MNAHIKTGIALATFLGVVGLVSSWNRTSSQGGRSVAHDAPAPAPGSELSGSRLTRLPDGMAIDVNTSILPALLTAEGASLRSVWTNAVCTKDGVVVGETRYHAMVSSLSESPIDLTLVGVDVAPDDPDPASLRSYRVVLSLRSGVTWGSARTFEGDLELTVAPGPR